MQQTTEMEARSGGIFNLLTSTIGRLIISLFVPIVTFIVLWQGFIFLRDSAAPKLVIVLVAIIWGVGGVALLYLVSNWLIEQLSPAWAGRLQPFVFVGPAVAILAWYLAIPTVRTFWITLFDNSSVNFVGLQNYVAVFTNRTDHL